MTTGIGETLRAARRRYGRSLADAAAETRVRETYLAALEEEEFAALGGSVYVKGFLRSYAKFLGLDPEPLLDAYRSEYERDDEAALPQRPVPPMGQRERRSGPAVIVVAAGALLLVLAGLGLWVGGGDEERVPERGPAPVPDDSVEEEATAPTPTTEPPTVTPSATPPTTPDVAPDELEVVLSVTGPTSWMRIEVDDETVLEGVRERGFSETFTGENVVALRIGDASAVSVQVNGQEQGTLGSANQVVVVVCNAGDSECDVDVVA